MIYHIHSHAGGKETIPKQLLREITDSIDGIETYPAKGASSEIRKAFISGIRGKGWSAAFRVSRLSNITITSLKQQIGLCLQTGNMSRMYADLLKLQTLCCENKILAAIIALPSHSAAIILGDNIANADRLIRELPVFSKAYTVPTAVISIG